MLCSTCGNVLTLYQLTKHDYLSPFLYLSSSLSLSTSLPSSLLVSLSLPPALSIPLSLSLSLALSLYISLSLLFSSDCYYRPRYTCMSVLLHILYVSFSQSSSRWLFLCRTCYVYMPLCQSPSFTGFVHLSLSSSSRSLSPSPSRPFWPVLHFLHASRLSVILTPFPCTLATLGLYPFIQVTLQVPIPSNSLRLSHWPYPSLRLLCLHTPCLLCV